MSIFVRIVGAGRVIHRACTKKRPADLAHLFAVRVADPACPTITTCYFGVGAAAVATALEDRQLAPDAIRKQWFAIRDRTILAIRDVRNNIVRRANEAKATERWMIEKLMSEESDERILREFSITLKDVPTKELVDYLRYLVQIGDRVRIQSVRMVFAARDDRQAYEVSFGKMLAQFALAENGDLGERITRISRLAEKMDARLANLFCAYSIPNRSHALTSPRSGIFDPTWGGGSDRRVGEG